jgi:membrane protein DedA with SNARE-associated domain
MSFSDYLLSTLGVYGLPMLFGTLLFSSIGVPIPASLLLLASGSFVEQGEMNLWPVIGLSAFGAILGDQVGYVLGRWGGRRVTKRLGRFVGGEQQLLRAEGWLKRWQGAGIFFSRWLLTPLGPVINVTCGMTNYSWPRFLVYDILGEGLWVVLYVLLGRFFSDRVQAMSDFLGDLMWLIMGLLFVIVLGWNLIQYFRSPSNSKESPAKSSSNLIDETS